MLNVTLITCRSAAADGVQQPRSGHPAHPAGDVQLPPAPHTDPLPRPAAGPPPHAGIHTADQPEPATPVVRGQTKIHNNILFVYSWAKQSELKKVFNNAPLKTESCKS